MLFKKGSIFSAHIAYLASLRYHLQNMAGPEISEPLCRYVRKHDVARNHKPRPAMVQWWNSSNVYVKCPFCSHIHRHGFTTNYSPQQQLLRVSHCFNEDLGQRRYRMVFPFSEATGESNYEINRDRDLFVTVGADLFAYYGDDEVERLLGSFEQQLKSKKKWCADPDLLNGDDPDTFVNNCNYAASQLVTGHIEYIRHFLESSPESQLFIHGIVDDAGNTALHNAACEQHWEMLQLLLQKGAEVNAVTNEGRTALMEAALWGRVDNVNVLLDHGADPALVCVRNNRQLQAIDFARVSDDNQEERSRRARGVYKEDVDSRSRDRKTIESLLLGNTPPASDATRLRSFTFTASPIKSNIITLFAMFDVPSSKTLGVIWRGPKFPTVAAMSGWTHSADDVRNVTIGGKDWTPNVLKLYKQMKVNLEPHKCDQGIPGQFYASHVEKQLIAWFIDHHLLSVRAKEVEANEMGLLGRMMEELSLGLRHEPPVSLKKAEIMVCRHVCPSCCEFAKTINSAFGLDIRLRGCPISWSVQPFLSL
jgi:hypothetical protein